MADRNRFSERAIQVVAEDKIRAAMAAGEFANLPGLGQPLALINEPYDPFWWVRRKLRREELLPKSLTQNQVDQSANESGTK